MDDEDDIIKRIIEENQIQYGDEYTRLKWLPQKDRETAETKRQLLLSSLIPNVQLGFKNTKLDCRSMSPGCSICGQGSWSCLFINGKCNCRCFFCPTSQNEAEVPTTLTVPFANVDDYVAYVEAFGIKGVGISGGEPLLTYDRVISYISSLKKQFGEQLYIWLYTNGTLVNENKLLQLRDAGLDEIRFDICATRYNLKKVRSAVGRINHVTVEIPAIPEDADILKEKLKEMADVGINFVNLHHLRLTPHNFKHLSLKNYTFLHGERVTVLESEWTALELLRYTIEHNIGLPINYCSFVYKFRYQRAAARSRNASFIKKSYENITENGYIRSLAITASNEQIENQIAIFTHNGVSKNLWQPSGKKDRLFFDESIWGFVDFNNVNLLIGYFESAIQPSVSYFHFFREIKLKSGKSIIVEKKRTGSDIELTSAEAALFEKWIIHKNADSPIVPKDKKWTAIRTHEFIPSGLQVYF